ncbi:IS3 family transposase [Hufsiella arboris]|uniref:IS3 family transposase n=1 Tax=Hufsiella arboris TaxID=2695275 RepID=UPI001F0160BB|nr:IS3 family transposase [Hufsiella arboris]
MKDSYSRVSLVRICRLLGITRQAYYQHFWQQEAAGIEEQLVLSAVTSIRKDHRAMGGRKLYEKLQPFLLEHQIKMGRDALFELLAANGLLVKKKRRRFITTFSNHWLRKWPNLIRNFQPTGINQLWVSDITYLKVADSYTYISLITDAYSHKIVGYHLAETLQSVETLKALQMALTHLPDSFTGSLIHHSDRGVQYCSETYVKLLQDYPIQISMTENGDPLENAIAERINGILKSEYLKHYSIQTTQQATALLSHAVKLYNQERPHFSIGLLTPELVHSKNLITEKLWKSYYQNRTIVNPLQDT